MTTLRLVFIVLVISVGFAHISMAQRGPQREYFQITRYVNMQDPALCESWGGEFESNICYLSQETKCLISIQGKKQCRAKESVDSYPIQVECRTLGICN